MKNIDEGLTDVPSGESEVRQTGGCDFPEEVIRGVERVSGYPKEY
jgi:hypothetical protein